MMVNVRQYLTEFDMRRILFLVVEMPRWVGTKHVIFIKISANAVYVLQYGYVLIAQSGDKK